MLTSREFSALREVGTGVLHGPIGADEAKRLLALGLVYNLLGHLRITRAGRQHLNAGNQFGQTNTA